jgi:hypothetical protein
MRATVLTERTQTTVRQPLTTQNLHRHLDGVMLIAVQSAKWRQKPNKSCARHEFRESVMKNIMFKFVKLGITILLLVSLNPQIKAQTVYQKKLIEIKKTYLKEALVVFGQWQEEMNSEIDNFSNNDVEQFLPNIKQGFLQVEDRESVKKTINNLELSVKQANELKSSDIDEKEEKEINKYIEDLKVQIGLSAEMIKHISDEKQIIKKDSRDRKSID